MMRFRGGVVVVGAMLVVGVLLAPIDRADAAPSIVVNKLSDASDPADGICTLREAIIAANTNTASGVVAGECAAGVSGLDTISFSVSGTIGLKGTRLPTIVEDLIIDADGNISVSGDDTSGVLQIDGVEVTLIEIQVEHGSAVDGAGIHVTGATLTINSSTIRDNTASGLGGGIYATGSTVNVNDSDVVDNAGSGGGVFARNTNLNVTDSHVDSNTSTTGTAGITARLGTVVDIKDSTISQNETTTGIGAGGMAVMDFATATITDTEISFNENTGTLGSRTGALSASSATNATLERSTISNNTTAGTTIGASGTVTILNSTISGNTAYSMMQTGTNSELMVLHSTITNNTGRGIRSIGSGDVTIGGSIIADNTAIDFEIGSTFAGVFISEGYNVFGVVSDLSGTAVFDPTDLIGVASAGLEPLANNGGPTKTHALSPGSPALDLVTGALSVPFTKDQRGIPRPQGPANDAGAYELKLPGLTVLGGPCVIYDSQTATAAGLGGTFVGGDVREVQVTGALTGQGGASSCVPAGASSVVFRISSIDPLTEGNLLMTPTGVTATGSAGVVNYGAANGLNNANTVTVPVPASGAVDIGANAGPAGVVPTTDVRLIAIGFYSPNVDPDLKFFPLNPCAVADTRTMQGASNTYDGPSDDGLWPVGLAFPDIDVVGVFNSGQGGGNGATGCDVPASADAVMINVVAVNMKGGSGHLSVATGGTNPIDEATTPFAVLTPKMNNGATTIINLGPGGTVAIDIDGDLAAATMIRVEILGYYDNDAAGLDFVDVTPCAVFDTRSGQGADGNFEGERQHGPANTTTYQISGTNIDVDQGGIVDTGGGVGTCGVPDGAQAVLINLEAVNALIEGNYWVSAAGTTTTGGVLNFNAVLPKMNNANAVVVPLSTTGQLDLEINAGNFTTPGTNVAQARGVILGYYN